MLDLHGRLMGWFSSGYVGANIVVPQWWEADVLRVTDANRWDEVEIKLTAADFRKDATKEKLINYEQGSGFRKENKHELLAAGDPRGPNRFWFAVPLALFGKLTFPEWSGVLTYERVPDRTAFSIRIQREAPLLHKEATGGRVRNQLFTSIYYRYANAKCVRETFLIDGEGI